MTESSLPDPAKPAHFTLMLAVCCPVCGFDLVSVRRLLSDYSQQLRVELATALVAEGEEALREHLRWTHQMEPGPSSPTPATASE